MPFRLHIRVLLLATILLCFSFNMFGQRAEEDFGLHVSVVDAQQKPVVGAVCVV